MKSTRTYRCAVYTRKSSEDGLEQEFNSLDAQREACEAFIRSQKGEGWKLIETAYDDGGISGGTMERPALQRLLADIALGKVDIIVVYKVDRLTRSLADFAKMVEVFDAHGVSFVAVTQQFNTTTSMGRLTLNILLSFAQFEREVTGERIRDKIAASKKKGMWMGGNLPIGYDVKNRELVINPAEAEVVRHIFQRYLELDSVRLLQEDLERRGVRAKSGRVFYRGALYALLANPIYIGEIRHKTERYPGRHEAIIDRTLWDEVQKHLKDNGPGPRYERTKADPSPLAGKLFDEAGEPLTPSHAVKGARRYRYYISRSLITGRDTSAGWRIPAHDIEKAIADSIRTFLASPGTLTKAAYDAQVQPRSIPELLRAASAWKGDIFPLVERVSLAAEILTIAVNLRALSTTLDHVVTVHVPMHIKRRGVEMRLVIPGQRRETAKADPALLKAIARGYAWFDELASGRSTSAAEIAKREGVSDRYVSHLLPLAFLAPNIVEAIVAGQHPADLSTKTLTERVDLPLSWDDQRSRLGFA